MRFPRVALPLLFLVVAAAPARHNVVIATAEGRAPGAAAHEMEAFLAHLNASPDLHVTVETFPSYDDAFEMLKTHKADLMLAGSVKYVQAHDEIGAIPVVVEAPKWLESVLFVAKDSPITSVAQLKGKRFAFGYKGSTTTFLLPLLLLSKYHLRPGDLGKEVFIGPEQDSIVNAVVSGAADAGAIATVVFDAHKDRIRALDTSERVPGGTIIARKDIDPALLTMLRQRMIAYKPPPSAHHERFGEGAEAVSDADYNKVRFLCRVLFDKTYR